MSHNLILATWTDSSKAFEAFSELKNSELSNIHQALVIQRQSNANFEIKEQLNNDYGSNTLGGGLAGSLLGILGGPLGVLLGFSSGALIGSLFDDDQALSSDSVLTTISKKLPLESTALLIDLDEVDEKVADKFFDSKQAILLRWDYATVEAEVEASVEAWDEAQRIAQKTLSEQKKAEHKEKRQQKWEAFKAKFHK